MTSPLLVDHLDTVPIDCDVDISLQYRVINRMREDFIKSFLADYLVSLKGRHYSEHNNNYKCKLSSGDLVFVNLGLTTNPRVNWPMAKIICIKNDRYGLPREADVLQGGKQYTRPLDRLIPLELSTVELDTKAVTPEPAVALAVPQQPVIRNVPKRRAAGRCDANRLEWLRGKQL